MGKSADVRVIALIVAGIAIGALADACAAQATPAKDAAAVTPPDPADPPREFRGLFVSSVYYLDWPSSKEVDADGALKEIEAAVARAKELNFNVIILQVRGLGDVIYQSTVGDPWSKFVPKGSYDPLDEWITQCHDAGIELHAWINPYRTVQPTLPNDLLPQRPDEKHRWYDPASENVQEHIAEKVVGELLTFSSKKKKRTDDGGVDGVLIDHYYYPHPPGPENKDKEKDKDKDEQARAADKAKKREHVDKMMAKAFKKVFDKKSWVKFGLSPRAIPRKNVPPGANGGYDQYEENFADVTKWWKDAGCHYVVPEFEARWDTPGQDFKKILNWWKAERPKPNAPVKPLLLAGIKTAQVVAEPKHHPWPVSEVLKQVDLAREVCPNEGQVHYAWRALKAGLPAEQDIGAELLKQKYAAPALVPQCVDSNDTPKSPDLTFSTNPARVAHWKPQTGEPEPWLWVVWWWEGADWRMEIYPGIKPDAPIPNTAEWVAVRAVNKFNRLGPVTKKRVPPK